VVALPETVVHCAGRSLYHRIKTWFWRCLSAQHAEKLPNHGRILCLSIRQPAAVAPKKSQVMRTAPRELLMSRRRTHGLVPLTRRLVPNPSRRKAPLWLRAANRDSQPVAFFPSPSQAMQTTLIPSTVRHLSGVPFSCTQYQHKLASAPYLPPNWQQPYRRQG
jgi:hypothetical protein